MSMSCICLCTSVPTPVCSQNLVFQGQKSLPKFDELVLVVHTHIPDVVCITESWLCPEIQESEVSLPGYISAVMA